PVHGQFVVGVLEIGRAGSRDDCRGTLPGEGCRKRRDVDFGAAHRVGEVPEGHVEAFHQGWRSAALPGGNVRRASPFSFSYSRSPTTVARSRLATAPVRASVGRSFSAAR